MFFDGSLPPEASPLGLRRTGLRKIYQQGALTNILNPKVAVFFLPFLPQFTSASSPSKPLSSIVPGLIFMTTGALWCLLVAIFASSFGRHLHSSAVASKRLRRVNNILFILLGLKLATAKLNS